MGAEEGRAFDRALQDLYEECDLSVGELVEAAGGASVIVFALHGMTANSCRNDFLDAMLSRVLGEDDAHRRGALRKLGEALPLGLRRAITQRVPERLANGIMTRWVTSGTDWSRTEAFGLRADHQGYLRINLQGREAEGIVRPAAYEELCDRISTGLTSFRDVATGRPVVAEVSRPLDVFGPGDQADRLPDLVVRWADGPAAQHDALGSDGLGRIARATPGRVPNGRSGNHRAEGFFIATGRDVAEGERREEIADILDLAPTALQILGASCRAELAGRPIPLSASSDGTGSSTGL
jgi:predicted AlkP superfamily phosphohydrolase/phosphomutase